MWREGGEGGKRERLEGPTCSTEPFMGGTLSEKECIKDDEENGNWISNINAGKCAVMKRKSPDYELARKH